MINNITQSDLSNPTSTTRWKRIAPILVLIFLAPVLAELLMGVVHLTNIWLLVPEMSVYGTGALLVREVVRRQHKGWGTILSLAIAFAIAEECIILQTSFTPQFFPNGTQSFGWAFGVHWIYLAALLWYESVFAIVLPIYLTEILFPDRRDELWLDRTGFIAAIVIFLLASFGVWLLWSRVGLLRYGPSSYHIPPANVGIALVVIVLLVAVTLIFRRSSRPVQRTARQAWAPWLVGFMAFGHSLAWFILIGLAYIPPSTFQGASPVVPIVIGLLWIGLALLVVWYLSTARDWGDRQRLTLIFGASLGNMVGGVLVIITAARIDQIGKFVIDLIAVVLFILLVRRVKQRPAQS